jgi:hypothetical protein
MQLFMPIQPMRQCASAPLRQRILTSRARKPSLILAKPPHGALGHSPHRCCGMRDMRSNLGRVVAVILFPNRRSF